MRDATLEPTLIRDLHRLVLLIVWKSDEGQEPPPSPHVDTRPHGAGAAGTAVKRHRRTFSHAVQPSCPHGGLPCWLGKGDSDVIQEALRRDLGLDLLERSWVPTS